MALRAGTGAEFSLLEAREVATAIDEIVSQEVDKRIEEIVNTKNFPGRRPRDEN